MHKIGHAKGVNLTKKGVNLNIAFRYYNFIVISIVPKIWLGLTTPLQLFFKKSLNFFSHINDHQSNNIIPLTSLAIINRWEWYYNLRIFLLHSTHIHTFVRQEHNSTQLKNQGCQKWHDMPFLHWLSYSVIIDMLICLLVQKRRPMLA